MRKKVISALYIILLCLPFSCSELILPKNIDVHGTLDLAIKVTADNWGNAVAKVLKKALIKNSDKIDMIDFDAEIYDVNYGQEEQTFLIYLRSEMTNHLDPSEYLQEAGAFLYQIGTSDPFEIFYEIDVGDLKEQTFSVSKQTFAIPDFASGIPLPIPSRKLNLNTELDLAIDGFLHTAVTQGKMEIIVDLLNNGKDLNNSAFDITLNIDIEQEDNLHGHDGLFFSIVDAKVPFDVPLNDKDINDKKITVKGSVEIKTNSDLPFESGEIEVNVTIKIALQRLKEVHWDFSYIKDRLNLHQISPVPLDKVTPYVNYVLYDEKGEKDEKGIGLLFEFENMIDGLEMSIESTALGIEPDFQELIEGGDGIIYANKKAGTLWLNGKEPQIPGYDPFTTSPTKFFDFDLKLRPKGGGDVLHIEPVGGIPLNDTLTISGKAHFFQNWIEAQLNMVNIIKAAPYATGEYMGSIPKEDKEGVVDPIDLSALTDYITGFTFEDIQSEIHINGPRGVVNDIGEDLLLSLKAYHWQDDATKNKETTIYKGSLQLEETPFSLDASYFDVNGSYKKKDLPPGKPFHFSDILDEQPKKLVFIYELKIPDTLTVTCDLFDNASTVIDSKITVSVLIMLPLKLKVAENGGPGMIKFPDMFDGAKDLFGRDNTEEDSVLNTLGIEYIKFSIDFTGAFFYGGKLFLEKEGKELLFPDGISLDGKKIILDVSGAHFETVKNNLIDPDLRLIFASPGSSLNVPRNIGLSNIKVEAKGKFEF